MIARNAIPDSSGFPVRWFGGFAVVELPAGRNFLTAPALTVRRGRHQPHAVPDRPQEKATAWGR